MAAQTCSRCQRPSSLSARSCMYCGAPLSPSADGLSTPVSALPPAVLPAEPDDGRDDYMVMVTPADREAAAQAPAVAAILEMDNFIVRQRLLRGRPFVATGGMTADEAHDIQSQLAGLGIAASAFSETVLRAIPSPAPSQSGRLEGDDAVFELVKGEEVSVPLAAVFLVVQGEVTERRRDRETRKMVIHTSKGTYTVKDQSVTHGNRGRLVVDIYHTTSVEAIRLTEDRFRIPSSPHASGRNNLLDFVKKLRAAAPNEVFDASFGELDAVNVMEKSRSSRGITASVETSIADNEEEFDSYSACLFLHVLKLKRKST